MKQRSRVDWITIVIILVLIAVAVIGTIIIFSPQVNTSLYLPTH